MGLKRPFTPTVVLRTKFHTSAGTEPTPFCSPNQADEGHTMGHHSSFI